MGLIMNFSDIFLDFEAFESLKLIFREISFGFVELNTILKNAFLNFLNLLLIMIDLIACCIEYAKILIIERVNIVPIVDKLLATVEV